MMRTMMKSKIHRATVIEADLHYVGSITIDNTLLKASNILPGELVHVVDINNGNRLETYAIEGKDDSGIIGINGAAAHLIHPGHKVIIMSYGQYSETELASYEPEVVHVDDNNRIITIGHSPAESYVDEVKKSPLAK